MKPLVRALLIEGVPLWLDRPGHGDSHFNFDAAYIERHDIADLQRRAPWTGRFWKRVGNVMPYSLFVPLPHAEPASAKALAPVRSADEVPLRPVRRLAIDEVEHR